jgi:hypothetical protein
MNPRVPLQLEGDLLSQPSGNVLAEAQECETRDSLVPPSKKTTHYLWQKLKLTRQFV